MTRTWRTRPVPIDLSQPQVMGIVNVTPDSFSDGGAHASTKPRCSTAKLLIRQGADILDIGGESTRPGSPAVSLDDELARVMPVVREAVKLGVPLSIDTYKPEVMRAALDLGADIVNDIWALRQPGALEAVAAQHLSCGVCLMHMHRDPQTMQAAPMAGDVVPVVAQFLTERANALRDRADRAFTHRARSGHRLRQDGGAEFRLAGAAARTARSGLPLLVGWSRKSSLGAATGIERLVNGWCPAWPRRCWPWSAGRPWCACTMCAIPWRAGRLARRCAPRTTRLSARGKQQHDTKYFGTDGIRGTVGQPPITPDFVLRLAHAVGRVLKKTEKRPTVLIGKDTRISGYMLESALESGFNRPASTSCCSARCPRPAWPTSRAHNAPAWAW
jgi:dihydropteroate synthase